MLTHFSLQNYTNHLQFQLSLLQTSKQNQVSMPQYLIKRNRNSETVSLWLFWIFTPEQFSFTLLCILLFCFLYCFAYSCHFCINHVVKQNKKIWAYNKKPIKNINISILWTKYLKFRNIVIYILPLQRNRILFICIKTEILI